jgi:hypothetical protein
LSLKANCILGNSRPDFAKWFEDEEWLEKLANIADIFHNMNQLDRSRQGSGEMFLLQVTRFLDLKGN